MTLALSQLDLALTFSDSECLFEKLCSDIEQQGYSINPMALPLALADGLLQQANTLQEQAFEPAGIGRNEQHLMNNFVRSDEIVWINGESRAESAWLDWSNSLKRYLNRRLYLGLFSFESHFASYKAGHFYKRHLDAFHGQTNRVLSLVVYLNKDWQAEDGGELVLYRDEHDKTGTRVTPGFATLVAFLSESFPHEVLPAKRERLSIAGWFSVNQSINNQLNPPT